MARTEDKEDCEALVPAPRRATPGVALLAVLASAVGAATLIGGASLAWGAGAAKPVTVRALLQSDAVAETATDNLMALHGGALGRAAVRARVAHGLGNIDAAIEQLHPEAHRRLSELELSGEEAEAAMRALRAFGDARMVAASRAVLEEMSAGGDDAALSRRISERLAKEFPDLERLRADVPPPQAQAVAPAAGGRRLDASDAVSTGVNTQVHTLFRSLEGALGERMPKEPARMLLSSSSSSNNGMNGGTQNTSFLGCMKDAVPDPSKMMTCMVQNFEEVLAMMKNTFKSMTSR